MWVVDLSAAQKEKTKEVLKSKNPNTVHLRIEILPQSTLLAESVDEDEMMSTMRKLFHAPQGATLQIARSERRSKRRCANASSR